ncbi:pyridoxal phosphate-dependent transferase [Lanmaoa asiatica]|nr:pyridoxal phosphate-dependent transferase [Lanmaoa asiatica]
MTINNAVPTDIVPNQGIDGCSDTKTPKQLHPEFYKYFLSDAARERKPSAIRRLLPLEDKPGVISLLAGKPNDAMFPFQSFSFTITDPSHSSQSIPVSITSADLAAGLQYGPTAGLPRLNEWFVGLQERVHGRKRSEGWRLTIGNGSQDMIFKAINAIVTPGDPILVEAPAYPGVLPILRSLHCELVEVATDGKGVCSSDLRSILENWPAGKQKPKAFYTVPYGGNPSGVTAAIERRREVLRLAREYNFLILEDDPYYYLYFGEAERPPSYFKLELETPELGRVIRFDSFSKILSAGMRMGFASGPEPIIDAIDHHTTFANLQGSSLVQAITLALVEKWGYEGFHTHTKAVAEFYRERRDTFEKALQTHLGDLAEWRTPEAGMFFWFKLLINRDPNEEGDSKELIETKAYENGVLALPGTVFLPDGRKTAYVRAAFSLSTAEQVNEALRRLRVVLLRERDGK